MNIIRPSFGRILLPLLFFPLLIQSQTLWTIHEWGTFTSLQDENGGAIGGINTDDEPVPGFVHRLADLLLLKPSEAPGIFYQGAPSCHPDVTMRLETPVIYFHAPANFNSVTTADVRVQFNGGWLAEFFPYGLLDAPGFEDRRFTFPHLTADTKSRLAWNQLRIGGDWPLTNTTAHVWTSPRAVKAESVLTTNGETEKFLFYRGVAHIDAPLRIPRDSSTGELIFKSQLKSLPIKGLLTLKELWLVHINANGEIAFRPLPQTTLDSDDRKILFRTSATFAGSEYSKTNLGRLKESLRRALIADGLFADEAEALLNTWELSYFKSPGLRVFFLVPRVWTDFYLPLETTLPTEFNRVMVGRIELVTPEQRHLLQKLAQYSPDEINFQRLQLTTNFYGKITFYSIFGNTNPPTAEARRQLDSDSDKLAAGKLKLSEFVTVPDCYQTYLDLGRFRNALLLNEARNRPNLTNFISAFRLSAYEPFSPATQN